MSESNESSGLSEVAQAAVQSYQDNFQEPSSEPVAVETSATSPESLDAMAGILGLGNGEAEEASLEEAPEATEESQAEEDSSAAEDGEEESESSEEEDEAKSESEDTEVLEIDGKKLTVKYTDRDWIKKTAKAAANFQKGMRKFQKERDEAVKELESAKPDIEKYREGFQKMDAMLDEAVASGDYASFITAVTGQDFGELVEQHIAKSEYLSAMTDEERDSYKERLAEKKRMRDMEKELQKLKDDAESAQKKAEKSEKQSLSNQVQSQVESAFHQYKLKDIGDDQKALRLNKIVFNNFKAELNKYEAKDLSLDLIHKIMEQEAATVKKDFSIGKSSKAQAKQVKKKANTAKEITKAVEQNKPKPDIQEHLNNRDMTGAITNFLFGQ